MGVIDLVFPKKCLGCGKEGNYLCSACVENLRTPFPICPVCLSFSQNGKTHLRCKKENSIDGLISVWIYERAIRKAILALKYKFGLEISKEIAKEAGDALKRRKFFNKPVLVPIPLYRRRENWRGFNQSAEIAKFLAREMGWEFAPNILIRKVASSPQTELTREERVKNVKGIFEVKKKTGKRPIFLFDDVWTTGSTIKEAARKLKEEGTKEVWGLTITKGR